MFACRQTELWYTRLLRALCTNCRSPSHFSALNGAAATWPGLVDATLKAFEAERKKVPTSRTTSSKSRSGPAGRPTPGGDPFGTNAAKQLKKLLQCAENEQRSGAWGRRLGRESRGPGVCRRCMRGPAQAALPTAGRVASCLTLSVHGTCMRGCTPAYGGLVLAWPAPPARSMLSFETNVMHNQAAWYAVQPACCNITLPDCWLRCGVHAPCPRRLLRSRMCRAPAP